MLFRHRIMLAVVTTLFAGSMLSAAPAAKTTTLESKFPRLSSGPLSRATVADLPSGIVLSMDGLNIRTSDLTQEIATYPASVRPHLNKYQFFALEQMAARKLLVQEANNWASKNGVSASGNELLQKYLRGITTRVTVTDKEVTQFYNENRAMFQGATLSQVKADVKAYLEDEKRQAAINRHVDSVSSRHPIRISSGWAGQEYKKWIQNPVERARRSGKPTLVDFGKDSCEPCRIMAPLLDALRKEYAGKLNVIFVHVEKEPILSDHYQVEGIPMQVFYDKSGKEVDSNSGLLNRNQINERLKKIGIR